MAVYLTQLSLSQIKEPLGLQGYERAKRTPPMFSGLLKAGTVMPNSFLRSRKTEGFALACLPLHSAKEVLGENFSLKTVGIGPLVPHTESHHKNYLLESWMQ